MEEKKTILIVDDVEMNRRLLSLMLQDTYRIVEANNGLEALKILQRGKHTISLIMLDIIMPVMDGFELLDRIKESEVLRDIPIVFVTSETSKENIEKGIEQGVCDVIAKPFNPSLICSRVSQLILLTESRRIKQNTSFHAAEPDNTTQSRYALIIDDIEINRVLIRTAIEPEYNTIEAENGQDALATIQAYKGEIAIVLLDIVMPVMDGVEMMVQARHRKLLEDVPIIAITAGDSPVKMEQMKELGICEIIHKPYHPAVVKNRVNNMIELFSNKRHLAL